MKAKDTPRGAVVEIFERSAHPPNDIGIVIPNEVRINGIPLLTSAEDPVEVHGIALHPGDPVKVTLTLFARRVVIAEEQTEEPPVAPPEPKVDGPHGRGCDLLMNPHDHGPKCNTDCPTCHPDQ